MGIAKTVARRLRRGSWVFRIVASAVVATLVTALVAAALAAGVFGDIRRQLQDRLYPNGPTDARVLVVEITADDVELYGAWPWPRTLHAQLTRRLADAGAGSIAFDVVFSDLPTSTGDEEFATAIADAGNVVLAMTGSVSGSGSVEILRLTQPRDPAPSLADAAVAVAHANVLGDDADGVVRGVPIVVEVGRTFVAALSAAAVAVADGVDPSVPTLRPTGVQLGPRVYPAAVADRRVFDLNWSAGLLPTSPARPVMTATQVLAGDFDPAFVADRIVLIGVADPLEGDIVATPVAKVGGSPGVYVHANAINTILTNRTRQPVTAGSSLLLSALLAFVAALAGLTFPLWWSPALVVVGVLAYVAWADLRFQQAGSVDLLWPDVALVLGLVGAVVIRYLTEVREGRRVATLFGQYVPPAVAQELIAEERVEAAAQGERLDVTVFFCDLRGFTQAAAKLEPTQVRDLLNAYYDHVTDVIFAFGGTVMQYVGDEVFAVFGAPVKHEDHPQRALDCAVGVRDSIGVLNARLASDGLPPIAFGIGLNSGPVVAAHVGSARKQYSVIGDTVNVGSRFCALAKEHQIALPDELRVRLQTEPQLLPVGPVAMKGVERAIDVFKVGRTSDSTPAVAYETNLTVADESPKAVELTPDP